MREAEALIGWPWLCSYSASVETQKGHKKMTEQVENMEAEHEPEQDDEIAEDDEEKDE